MIIITQQPIGVEKTGFGEHFQGTRQVVRNTLYREHSHYPANRILATRRGTAAAPRGSLVDVVLPGAHGVQAARAQIESVSMLIRKDRLQPQKARGLIDTVHLVAGAAKHRTRR